MGFLGTNRSGGIRKRRQKSVELGLALIVAIGSSACLSPGSQGLSGGAGVAPAVSPSPSASPFVSDVVASPIPSGSFTISQVIKAAAGPATAIDIIGDGSGRMGTLCGGALTAQNCDCVFDISLSTGATLQQTSNGLFSENNLLRCVPPTFTEETKSVRISVTMRSDGSRTNVLDFAFATIGGNLSSTEASSYIKARRYQCRQVPKVPHTMDGYIIDPSQSEDPAIAITLNYWVTNLGQAIDYYTGYAVADGKTARDYECPTSISDLDNPWLNLTVYSRAASGTEAADTAFKIYDPARVSNPRSDFLLARKPAGVLSVPVHSRIAPSISTSSNAASGLPGPIGYAAAVNASEGCPAKNLVPSGYKWAKLWAFRGTIPARKAVSANTQNSTSIFGAGSFIACPGTDLPPQRFIVNGGVDSRTLDIAPAIDDFLFVVTPTDIRVDEMEFPSDSNRGFIYKPYRMVDPSLCSDKANPRAGTDVGCGNAQAFNRVDYNLARIDPVTGQAQAYPLCVIQKCSPLEVQLNQCI